MCSLNTSVALDGGDPVYREPIYCYKLYHQRRCQWPTNTPSYLNGELDKAAHPILRELGADYAKPDSAIHHPGFMAENHTIIKVKSSNAQRNRADGDPTVSPPDRASLRSCRGHRRAVAPAQQASRRHHASRRNNWQFDRGRGGPTIA